MKKVPQSNCSPICGGSERVSIEHDSIRQTRVNKRVSLTKDIVLSAWECHWLKPCETLTQHSALI